MKVYNQEQRLREALVSLRLRAARRRVERDRVQRGLYTNGEPMTEGDRKIYRHLSLVAVGLLVFIGLLAGAIVAVTV